MKKISRIFAAVALVAALSSPAFATTSSINPTQPAQNAPLLSATIRALALAAYNDITALFGDITVGANQILGSVVGGQAAPLTMPNCPGGIGYTTGSGFSCASGSSGITALTGDVTATGPGSVAAALANTATARTDIGLGLASTPSFTGLTLSGFGSGIVHSNGSGVLSSSALVAADLPLPSASSIGGVQSIASVSHNFLTSISTLGVPTQAQPAFTDISGVASAAQIPNPSASTLGGIQSYVAVSNQWINSISTSGVPSSTQPAFSNLSGTISTSQIPNTAVTPGPYTSANITVDAQGRITAAANGGGGGGVSSFTGDSGLISNSASTGAVTVTLTAATAKSLFGNSSASSGAPSYLTSPTVSGTMTAAIHNATTGGSAYQINGVVFLNAPDSGLDTTSVGVGPTALPSYATTTGNNSAVGFNALNALTTGTNNTAVGANALQTTTTDSHSTAVGSQALKNMAGAATTSALGNTAIGYSALTADSTGSGNVAVGNLAGLGITTLGSVTIIGSQAGKTLTSTGSTPGHTGDVMIGYQAGTVADNSANGGNLTLVGYQAGNACINCAYLTAVGYQAGTGISNNAGVTAIGFKAVQGANPNNVTAVGWQAGFKSGNGSTAIGYGALNNTSGTGTNNTAAGLNAGSFVTTGSNNVFIGASVASTTLTTGGSNILIGTSSGVDTPASGTSNYLNLGNMIVGDKSKGILIFEGPTTALGTCGSGSTLKAGSNDMSGEVTVAGASASCALNFANTHTAVPNCVVTEQGTTAAFGYSASTTALTVVATSLTGVVFDYFCPAGSTSTNPTP